MIKGDLFFATAKQILDRDRAMIEITLRQGIHAMPMQARMKRIGNQHRIVDGRDIDPVTRQHLGIIFHVLPDFQNRSILQQGRECLHNLTHQDLPIRQ